MEDKTAPQWQPGWIEASLPEVMVLLDNIRSAHNVGSIFRTCEGAGVTALHLCGLTPKPSPNPSLSKAALGAEQRLIWHWHPNSLPITEELKHAGFQIIVLEALPTAISLFSEAFQLLKPKKALLVFGSEPYGVDPALINLADQVVTIPMAGQKSSLNVSVACGIALYALLANYAYRFPQNL